MTDEKEITVKEFKMWLQGVMEMQEESWIPSAAQWAKICGKINQISEKEPVVERQAAPTPVPPPLQYAPAGIPHVRPAAPSSMPMQPQNPNAGSLFGNGNKVKTPDVDGPYGTPFV